MINLCPSLLQYPNSSLSILDRAQLSVTCRTETGHVSEKEAGSLVGKSISMHAYIQKLHAMWPENECLYLVKSLELPLAISDSLGAEQSS